MSQELSHPSVLFVLQLASAYLLMDIYVEDIELQDEPGWVLIVGALGLSQLTKLKLSGASNHQLFSIPHAMELFDSKVFPFARYED